ncbi:MAG: hypothetical protein UR66_C0013G0021 [Candidatus Moranbacteria bacterium GW2011_GWE1_35_17]|nr:MAG: hypothetical protein UR66_C0013G0021 [Candidatus Moranbacteria bacterium GW2011_GWE1_35_17]KKP71158.1 MAG: hypothetical protein UR65_C0036G0003 [Candidatus Moranbacteria bacterium GW2011_GWE2_35_164]KKP83914.1 MAG: hypothetical protein UR82_C0016G0014 [Candidatus Moranbacteria bacterium GW2011_GWF1_35_5]KKP84685.1 MAG: hypothetical protein UR83_C0015G0003 [Candidatus Moranbacteria bacterium GW2011_GWF2_35_54]
MENLIKNSQHLLKSLKTVKKRYLYEKIDFSQKMIGIIGQRGVGKTTIMLQFLKEKNSPEKTIYLTADDIYFSQNTLKATIETLYRDYGFRIFCIDEIHKYKNWNQELKNIYDLLSEIKVVFSGSSSLDVLAGAYDLSRRATLYQLNGLSFREFIEFKNGIILKPFSLEELLDKYKKYSVQISAQIEVLKLFKEYISFGYYPYFLEGSREAYELKMKNVLDKTIYEDIANLNNIKTENLPYFKKILAFLASIPPGEINVNKLASNLGLAFETAEVYMDILYRISLVRYLLKDKTGYKLIRKSAKVFLDNTNLAIYLNKELGLDENHGVLRELFILNQLQNCKQKIYASEGKGDFLLKLKDNKIILEVGGRSKDFKQISKISNAYLVLDGLEIAQNNKIPLWLFGFLY